MTNQEYARMKRLDRQAQDYGLSVRKLRNGGFYILCIAVNAVWYRFGTNLNLDDVEYILNHPDENGCIG